MQASCRTDGLIRNRGCPQSASWNSGRSSVSESLAQELRFSRAAERLFITQPPADAADSAIEEHAGVQLFQRNNKSVTLTVARQIFPRRAQKIMVLVHESETARALINDGKVGLLNIGYFGSAIFNDIPQLR